MKRTLKWIGWGALIIIVLAILLLGGPAAVEVISGLNSDGNANVTYQAADGTTLQGYLAEPAGEGPHPAVLLIHEWWGLNEDITEIADQLAAEGYVVLAPDALRGQLTDQVARAIYINSNTAQAQIDSDLDDALAYLMGLPTVDADRVATWGFCFGGRNSFYLGTRHPDLAAVVDFYGGGVEVNSVNDLGELTGPFLGIFGSDDSSIPLENIERLEAALNEAGIEHTITIYPNVGHAFLNSENLDNLDEPAGQAWEQTLAFLDTHLK